MMRSCKYICAITTALIISGCASKQIEIDEASSHSELQPRTIHTDDYEIQTLQPRSFGNKVRVYIESDGRAWRSSRTISDDPTPTKSLMIRYAIEDPENAIYMARPCQFISGVNCTKAIWTDSRFGGQVVSSMSQALDQIKSQHGVQKFELVGHSGGAAIALLLAAGRDDITLVQTIAGNVDHRAWTEVKNLSPLNSSLNPADYAEKLIRIPQRHFVGLRDQTVPGDVIYAYMLKVQPQCSVMLDVDADHWEGFDEAWTKYRGEDVNCVSPTGQ